MGTDSKFTQILERLLTQKRRPTLATHINMLGPAEWSLTGDKIMNKISMIGLVCKSMAKYLLKLEESPEEWHLALVRGLATFLREVCKKSQIYPQICNRCRKAAICHDKLVRKKKLA